MTCKKLTYQNIEIPLKVVYRKPIENEKGIQRFMSVDPLQFDYPYYTPYQYAGNKPISFIDLDGLEEAETNLTNVKPTGQQNANDDTKPGAYRAKQDDNGNYIGFEWDTQNAYNSTGELNEGYFEKAIHFTDNPEQTFDLDKIWDNDKNRYYGSNIGSSTATVFAKDEWNCPDSSNYNATTISSDPAHFATLKGDSLYTTKFGKHNGYDALNLYNKGSRTMPTEGVNPANERGMASGIGFNIHKAGGNNATSSLWKLVKDNKGNLITGMSGESKPMFNDLLGISGTITKGKTWNLKEYGGVSEGCPLISRNQWSDFISGFKNSDKNIGVIINRSGPIPKTSKMQGQIIQKTNVKSFINFKLNN